MISVRYEITKVLLSPEVLFERVEVRSDLNGVSYALNVDYTALSVVPLFDLPKVMSPATCFSHKLLTEEVFVHAPPVGSSADSTLLPLKVHDSMSGSASAVAFPKFA